VARASLPAMRAGDLRRLDMARFPLTRSILHEPDKLRKDEQFIHEPNWQKT
jgi:hypothetical protein